MVSLEQGEYIVKEVRKHWFFVALRIVFYGILGIAPALLFPFLLYALSSIFIIDSGTVSLFLALYPLWLLMLWISFFLFWTDFYLDVLIITNQRIMDIEQHGLFHREISEFRLENLQDITTDISGMVATFFDFGDVHVQTASENRKFIINDAAHPEQVKRLIADEHDRVMENLQHQRMSV